MKRSVFCGLLTIDLQFLLPSFPGVNSKSKAKEYGIYAGGPATNAAITSAFLGSNTSLITSIGKNNFTCMIEEELENHRVHFIDVDYSNDITPPFASIITSENNGDRTIFSYHPKNEHEKMDLPGYILENAGVLLIDGFYPGIAEKLCQIAKEKNIPVVLDGGSWKPYTSNLLPYVDIAICSENFLAPGTCSHKEMIELLKENGINKIAITRGGEPILACHENRSFEINPPKIKPVDTLGAGDVFHGAFIHFFSLGYDFSSSLVAASYIATLSCKSFGTRNWMKNCKFCGINISNNKNIQEYFQQVYNED